MRLLTRVLCMFVQLDDLCIAYDAAWADAEEAKLRADGWYDPCNDERRTQLEVAEAAHLRLRAHRRSERQKQANGSV